ncbi:polyhydroxyalkanoate depolymerase [Caballeronia sp. Sq4a]|uniref:polyhydroxyalkanoate depolymerase n=1 Tax=Caballeronia sp. Sq4a TaxID=2878152 RepID=UPI0020BE221C|nr:polyhydroxyalkanoate depolymerase [Caballeronia sp. Sq4a]
MPNSWLAYGRWLDATLFGARRSPAFEIGTIECAGIACPVQETIIDSVPFCDLRRFAAKKHATQVSRSSTRTAILLCAPLAGHHAVMLREAVETLLHDGDVYVTDWQDARDVPPDAGPLSLDDYVMTLERFVQHVQREHDIVHMLAICQAAPAALAAAALLADAGKCRLASITLMGGPVDARLNPTALERFASNHDIAWFRDFTIDTVPQPYAGATRRVYPGHLQRAALFAAHPERQSAIGVRYWLSAMNLSAEPFANTRRELDEYAAVLDMPEAYFLDIIRVVFQDALPARGLWHVDSRKVRPETLRETPLCTIEGDRDDITGEGQTHAAHALCAADRTPQWRLTIDDCNHYDLFTGPRWRDAIHPALAEFWQGVNADKKQDGRHQHGH